MSTVKVKVGDHFAEIEALQIEGDFALHGSVEQNKIGYIAGTKLFTITHVPTGLSVISRVENKSEMLKAFSLIVKAPSLSIGLIEIQRLKGVLNG